MRRTVTDARRELVALTPQLNSEMFKRLSQEVDAATREANSKAAAYMDRTLADASTGAKDTLTAMCEVRDQLAVLAANGRAGKLSASDYQKQFQQLSGRNRQLSRSAEDLERKAALLEAIEDDPVGWVDERLYSAHEQLKPDFTF